MYRFPLGWAFFGLTPEYRNILFTQIHDLVYHGGGGFKHEEVYNMPTWMRKFHLKKIQQFLEEKYEKEKEEVNKHKSPSKSIMGPNISPSSTYNFKK